MTVKLISENHQLWRYYLPSFPTNPSLIEKFNLNFKFSGNSTKRPQTVRPTLDWTYDRMAMIPNNIRHTRESDVRGTWPQKRFGITSWCARGFLVSLESFLKTFRFLREVSWNDALSQIFNLLPNIKQQTEILRDIKNFLNWLFLQFLVFPKTETKKGKKSLRLA